MATVIANLVETQLQRGRDGFRHTRVYLVDFGTVPPAGSPLFAALGVAGIPTHGLEDPEIPGIFALDFDAALADPEGGARKVRIAVTFRRPESSTQDSDPGQGATPSVEQTGARAVARTRTQDIGGNPIQTSHEAFREVNGETLQDETITQPAEVEVQVPQAVLSLQRTTSSSPLDDALTHVGTINADSFRGRVSGSWLCTAIEGTSEDSGVTWRVTYEFEYSPSGWDVTVVYIDPETDRPPEVLNNGEEIREFTVYPSTTFGDLGL